MIGIDTPEVYFGAECGGSQASAAMNRILHGGDRVKLIRDRSQDNRDHYDRLLRYVIHAGRDVGRRQIRKGWAKPYVFESPFKRLSSYRSAGRAAKRSNRGAGACATPTFISRFDPPTLRPTASSGGPMVARQADICTRGPRPAA